MKLNVKCLNAILKVICLNLLLLHFLVVLEDIPRVSIGKMIIKKVEISNILGVKSATLSFKGSGSVLVVQSAPDCPIRSSLSTAIELVVSAKYAYIESLVPLKDIQSGFVCLTFLLPQKQGECLEDSALVSDDEFDDAPSTSRQAIELQQRRMLRKNKKSRIVQQVVALRDFQTNASEIEFSIDNEPKQLCSPAAFHGRFQTNVEYIFPYIDRIYETRSGNLLNCIVKNINCMWQEGHDLLDLYERVCSNTNSRCEQNKFLEKITTCFLHSFIAKSVIQKRYVMKVCHDIRTIFEFVTCDEYSVWFVISYQGKYIDMEDITIEELDFNTIETRIQFKNNEFPRLVSWKELNQVVRDLLLISLDLALAYTCKRSIIFIRQMDAIKEHQVIELSTAAYLQKMRQIKNMDWTCKNYLQRIIDVCNATKITAIIEHNAGLTLPPINANIIKCIKSIQSLEQSWSMILCDPEPCNLENVIDCIEESLF